MGKHASAKQARDRAVQLGRIVERRIMTAGRPALVYVAPDYIDAWDALYA
jgi:hypothetical protein